MNVVEVDRMRMFITRQSFTFSVGGAEPPFRNLLKLIVVQTSVATSLAYVGEQCGLVGCSAGRPSENGIGSGFGFGFEQGGVDLEDLLKHRRSTAGGLGRGESRRGDHRGRSPSAAAGSTVHLMPRGRLAYQP